MLEHRWFLSEQAGKDVGIDEAVRVVRRERAAAAPARAHRARRPGARLRGVCRSQLRLNQVQTRDTSTSLESHCPFACGRFVALPQPSFDDGTRPSRTSLRRSTRLSFGARTRARVRLRDARWARTRRSGLPRPAALARLLSARSSGRSAWRIRSWSTVSAGEQIHYLRFPTAGSGSLGLRQALEEQEFELYAPGLHHLAFAVDARRRRRRARGGRAGGRRDPPRATRVPAVPPRLLRDLFPRPGRLPARDRHRAGCTHVIGPEPGGAVFSPATA